MNARIAVIAVPYELGRLRDGVGRGPERLLERGAEHALASAGAEVTVELVEIDPRFNQTGLGEGDAGFELIRAVAERVRAARSGGAFPVMLSGSCFAGVGVVAGMDEPSPGVVWFDAHADFNEPVTSVSGYLDGMGLAVMTGSAWQGLLATVPGARPVPETAVVLAGARNLDQPEVERLAASRVAQVPAERGAVVGAAAALDVTGLYLHVDLDVLDRSAAEVNIYAADGGPDADELVATVEALLRDLPVRGISLTAYDPSYDTDDRVPPIALRILRAVAATR